MKTRAALCLLFLIACSKQPSESPPPHTTTVSASPPPPSAEPAASAPPPAPAPSPAPSPPEAPKEEPAPKVKIVSIGMHVAGGPYDEETKKPFLRAVEPHYAELAKCWKHVKEPKVADVGVDLLIPANGGKPKVSHPRATNVEGAEFLPCVVAFFEGIEFENPKTGGPRGVSYSTRWKPIP